MAVAMMMRVVMDREHGAVRVSNLRPSCKKLRPPRGGRSLASTRQRLAFGFLAERQQQQSDQEGDRRQRHRRADRPERLDAIADQERDTGADEAAYRGRERERARAA